jgi:SHS2 domain-containing protein
MSSPFLDRNERMPSATFSYLPHTADLRARLEAPDLAGLYQTAADLVRDILVGESEVAAREARALELGGGDEEERFHRFVRELVYLYDTEGFLPLEVELDASARVRGETFDDERHASERQIKAVTRHNYRFAQGADGYAAELVFDL